MVKRTKEKNSKKDLVKSIVNPEIKEDCKCANRVTLRQAHCDKKFSEYDTYLFKLNKKNIFYLLKKFFYLPFHKISRTLLLSYNFFKPKYSMTLVKLYLLILTFSLTILFIVGCANQLPPGGGEVDLIPPEIIYTYPENETINFDNDYVEFEFSEYVDKRSFKEALFISPALDKDPEISWSGKSVEVYFPDGLKDSVTYVVTVGTDVVDVNNKNRMANSYSITFSKSNRIDKRTIGGKVYGKDAGGALIYAYRFKDDTTKYLSRKPDYISQVGSKGDYQLKGLAEATYRVFAVKDQFRDLIYQADQDLIGMPFMDIPLLNSDSSFTGLDFFLTKIDTIKPRIHNIVMTDKNHIVVTLSEECDSATYTPENYSIIDSTKNEIYPIDFSFLSKSKKTEFVLSFYQQLIKDNTYYLKANVLTDKSGNSFENEFNEITVSEKPDTTAPKIINTLPSKKGVTDFKNPEIFIYFDDAIANNDVKQFIQFSDTLKNSLSFSYSFPDNAILKIKPDNDLKPDTDYLIKLNLVGFNDAAGNRTDSIFTLKFSTITGIEFTGLSGKINTDKKDVRIVLQSIKDEKVVYTAVPDNTSVYNFERIEPGIYTLWAYSDRDSSGTYSYGYPEPFKYSEEFKVITDTLNLRPRWSVNDYNIEF